MIYKHSIYGMTCEHCVKTVHSLIQPLELSSLNVSLKRGLLSYESDQDHFQTIEKTLYSSGYTIKPYKAPIWNYLSYVFIVTTFIFISKMTYNKLGNFDVNNSTAYLSVLLFGLVTSLHCVGMCGGIALSQTNFVTPKQNIVNTLLYNLGRLTTYSVIGGFLGLIGSQISISSDVKTIMFFIIGSIMLLIGFSNLGLVKFSFIKLGITTYKKTGKTPFIVGLMNGFMPCAPLQTMQLLALTTSSFISGFMVMMFFGLGTMPLLFMFSNLGLLMNKTHHHKIKKISALFVIVMSLMIFQQGFNSMGITLDQSTNDGLKFAVVEEGYQIVHITVDPFYTTEAVQVKMNVPVKLIIDVESISGCTANIMVPKYDVNTDLKVGEYHELIFTPTEVENLKITCWMSMVNTFLQVVE